MAGLRTVERSREKAIAGMDGERQTAKPIAHKTPSLATIRQLYGTAFRCGKPGCGKPLYKMNNETGEIVLNSHVSHICARSEGGRGAAYLCERHFRPAGALTSTHAAYRERLSSDNLEPKDLPAAAPSSLPQAPSPKPTGRSRQYQAAVCKAVARPRRHRSFQPGPAPLPMPRIADWILARVGTYLGECRDAVNQGVSEISAGAMTLGAITPDELTDYNAGFRRLSAYQVPGPYEAIKGDIVQVGNGIHTYVIVANLGGGNLDIVDANHGYDRVVQHYQRNYNSDAALSTIWRLGQP